jgi:hypothetical protein
MSETIPVSGMAVAIPSHPFDGNPGTRVLAMSVLASRVVSLAISKHGHSTAENLLWASLSRGNPVLVACLETAWGG